MLFHSHPNTCITWPANTRWKGQKLCSSMNLGTKMKSILGEKKNDTGIIDNSSVIIRDKDRCINCDICVGVCATQGINALSIANKDGHWIDTYGPLISSECVQWGQCINRWPTGALSERTEIPQVMDAIRDKDKTVVFQMAPAIRAAIA